MAYWVDILTNHLRIFLEKKRRKKGELFRRRRKMWCY